MKIAIAGKGGVGKSTTAAVLALLLAQKGRRVLVLDADPDANLASALGISQEKQKIIIPISKQISLIEERTGAKVDQYGQVFKLNPEVSDVSDTYAYTHNGVSLLVLGAVKAGGSGCACPENTFIRALVTDLVLYKNETLIMDMEAGIEHLGRATSRGVDVMVVVVEPGQRSMDCARTVFRMANEIGIRKIVCIGNKVTGKEDEAFITAAIQDCMPGAGIIGFLPYSDALRKADRDGVSALDAQDDLLQSAFTGIVAELIKETEGEDA